MKPFRITSLSLENIGPFGGLKLDFPEKPVGMEKKAEIHILTGENGTGKTTVLEAISRSLNNSSNPFFVHKFHKAESFGVPKNLTNELSNTITNTLSSWLEVLFSEGRAFTLVKYRNGSFQELSNNDFVNRANDSEVDKIYQTAFFAYSGYRKLTQVSIDEIKEISEDPMAQALAFQNSVNPELLLRWIANNIAKGALLKGKSNDDSSNKFTQAIHNIESTIQKIVNKKIEFSLELEPLAVKIEVDGEVLDFNLLPDGLKSIISWIADLLMRMDRIRWENDTPVFERNFILFLDEIEVHMHPAWQRKILPAVQELFPNAQIFISTHSPFVVGSVDGAWIHKFEKPNGDSKLVTGYPMLSEDAKSYGYWLDEVFGISEQFGAGVEKDMKEFYNLRNRLLKGENGSVPENLMKIGKALAEQSQEVNQIIQMEIRQINRLKGLQLSI